MAFPPDVINPREKENRPGLVYDPDKKSNFYVEDIQLLEDNISDIEEYLNTEPWSGGTGDVVGPSGSTDDDIALFNGATGKILKDSGKKIADLQLALGFTAENVSNKKTALSASDDYYPTCKAVKDVTDGKQASLGFTPENVSNKKTALSASDDYYPTCKAVKDVTDGKQASLGFTAENVANKATDLSSNDDTHYPTTKAVATALTNINIAPQTLLFPTDSSGTYRYAVMCCDNADDTVWYSCSGYSSGTWLLKRWTMVNGVPRITHSVTLTNQPNLACVAGITKMGNYVYVSMRLTGNGVFVCERHLASDLSGAVAMTISGSAPSAIDRTFIFNDGTYLYIYSGSGNNVYKYSVSGTTITYVTSIAFTSINMFGGIFYDGTNIYGVSSFGVIQKYALTGGSIITTTTYNFGLDFVSPQCSGVNYESHGNLRIFNSGLPATGANLFFRYVVVPKP